MSMLERLAEQRGVHAGPRGIRFASVARCLALANGQPRKAADIASAQYGSQALALLV